MSRDDKIREIYMTETTCRGWTAAKLIAFEDKVKKLFKEGKINCPVHLSGGNESHLLHMFDTIKDKDYVLSTHRNHYHYLLKGGDPNALLDEIMGKETGICRGRGRSMHIYDHKLHFYTSAIVGGSCGIAVGLGLGLKKKRKKAHVWCFVGDGAEDTGHYMEAVRFSVARKLPVTFVIEDNDLAVESTQKDRWHNYSPFYAPNVLVYNYTRTYPHVGVGEHVSM